MNLILQSSIVTLRKSVTLLSNISSEVLSDSSVSPYYSCIGSHVRHILDFYDCILNGMDTKYIDLTERRRDERMHCDCNYSIENINRVINEISKIDNLTIKDRYCVIDDLGLGKIEINYSLGAILAQANSHAIHHYAIINFILDRLGIIFDDTDFGYNPTTPKANTNLS
ncbi:hypothetical protein [Pontimicrobium sp. IMCC45349]|uniref:hypothetical protein n=1 Tax=Pontimicrobium sp. IMCC45349 TaxID=3391574 RepID=UPI0039A054D3